MSHEQKEYDRLTNELAEKIFLIHYKAYIDQKANRHSLGEIISIDNPVMFRLIETARVHAKGVMTHLTGGFEDPNDDPFL